jgi:hypothetical protein
MLEIKNVNGMSNRLGIYLRLRVASKQNSVPVVWRRLLYAACDNQFEVRIPAHSVNASGSAGSEGVSVASGFLCYNSDGSIRTSHNCSRGIERRGVAKIGHDACVLASSLPCHGRARFNADGRVFWEVGNVGGNRRFSSAINALDLKDTWGTVRSTGICRSAELFRTRIRAKRCFVFLVLCDGVTRH